MTLLRLRGLLSSIIACLTNNRSFLRHYAIGTSFSAKASVCPWKAFCKRVSGSLHPNIRTSALVRNSTTRPLPDQTQSFVHNFLRTTSDDGDAGTRRSDYLNAVDYVCLACVVSRHQMRRRAAGTLSPTVRTFDVLYLTPPRRKRTFGTRRDSKSLDVVCQIRADTFWLIESATRNPRQQIALYMSLFKGSFFVFCFYFPSVRLTLG
ncbi:uncharacterized protein BDZ83DRAFT_648933 [Colletotrichum acutatum]|uniref:Uncharacterized protein n=1 Tax=Glomerella acutata TaxID=27357 RepID=A0AAD8UQE6_GLOAC|nr:uncharacterized protein BDZ83DRAFT_648933 [Colletotrichum acutatum]KAK1728076.1 hypothetical protein BDZ83DRAFT_648933 [Colletotrichum acutatum]